jgi:DNA primase
MRDASLNTEATLLQQFGLAPSTVRKYVKDLDYPEYRIALPIYRPDGATRGVVSRAVRGYKCTGPKALTYLFDENALGISWYSADDALPIVVVVEDQLSAIKGVQEAPEFKWVSLLGTTLSVDRIAELQNKNSELVIALDADATSTSFDHARKWGQAFDRCRVAVLQKDVKDMTGEEIREKFN